MIGNGHPGSRYPMPSPQRAPGWPVRSGSPMPNSVRSPFAQCQESRQSTRSEHGPLGQMPANR